MKFQWKKLYQALDDLRVASGGGSWRHLATRSGVTPSLFTRISQGKPTSVRNLLKLMDILDNKAVFDFVTFSPKKVRTM